MLGTLLTCFLFILTHSVVAQAALPEAANGTLADGTLADGTLAGGTWATTHAGSVDGLGQPVIAALEVTERLYEAPDVADSFQTLLSIDPQPQRIFRLTLQSATDPNLRKEYELVKKAVSFGGELRQAYVNKPSIHHEVDFVILPQPAGLEGHFSRHGETSGAAASSGGSFFLKPVAAQP